MHPTAWRVKQPPGRPALHYGMGREPRSPDDRDAAKDIARDLAEIASHLSTVKGEAYNWLTAPGYGAPRHRIEDARASVETTAVEARRRVRLNEGRGR